MRSCKDVYVDKDGDTVELSFVGAEKKIYKKVLLTIGEYDELVYSIKEEEKLRKTY